MCVLGAVAPSLGWLAATQLFGRPMAICLGSRRRDRRLRGDAAQRAYAISVLAMATGFGAGLCVMALPLAGLGEQPTRHDRTVHGRGSSGKFEVGG